MDVLTKEQRSKNMRAIRNKGTKAEILLARALWRNGHRYRKNNSTVYGNPDLTFKEKRIAIFVDGEFFHGRDWGTRKFRIQSNRQFWWPKIERNIQRDSQVNDKLTALGWTVLRFWDTEILKELEGCVALVERNIRNK